jgi:uncharacterized phage protein (TIGR02216 family)
MAVGLGLLRLSPGAFWAMTPVEFERAASVLRQPAGRPPARAELAALMRAFPDPSSMEDRFG